MGSQSRSHRRLLRDGEFFTANLNLPYGPIPLDFPDKLVAKKIGVDATRITVGLTPATRAKHQLPDIYLSLAAKPRGTCSWTPAHNEVRWPSADETHVNGNSSWRGIRADAKELIFKSFAVSMLVQAMKQPKDKMLSWLEDNVEDFAQPPIRPHCVTRLQQTNRAGDQVAPIWLVSLTRNSTSISFRKKEDFLKPQRLAARIIQEATSIFGREWLSLDTNREKLQQFLNEQVYWDEFQRFDAIACGGAAAFYDMVRSQASTDKCLKWSAIGGIHHPAATFNDGDVYKSPSNFPPGPSATSFFVASILSIY
ncbi:unnamed protein product [Sympodiomycopsis kandeliae]